MPRDKDKDPWNRSFVSPSPSPSSFSDADEILPENGFINLSRDNDLANELDLSRREDRAVVKETPFTLAKLRAQQQASKGNVVREKDGSRMGRSIRTAAGDSEDLADSSAKATGTSINATVPKKRRVANTGWTDGDGEPLPAGPLRKNGKKGESTQVPQRSSKPARKVASAQEGDQPPAKGGRKNKKKKAADDDKIEFRLLPNVTSQSNFPIVAALERQRSLPEKKQPKKVAKKAATVVQRSGPSKPRQTKLDIDALFSGFSYKPSAKSAPKMAAPSSDASDPLDIGAALDKEAIKKYGHIPKPLTSGPTQSQTLTPVQNAQHPSPSSQRGAYSPVRDDAELAGRRGSVEVVDIRHSTPERNIPLRMGSQEPDCQVMSPQQVELVRPVALRPGDVRRLEALAADGPFAPASAHLPRRPPGGLCGRHGQPQETAFDFGHGMEDFDRNSPAHAPFDSTSPTILDPESNYLLDQRDHDQHFHPHASADDGYGNGFAEPSHQQVGWAGRLDPDVEPNWQQNIQPRRVESPTQMFPFQQGMVGFDEFDQPRASPQRAPVHRSVPYAAPPSPLSSRHPITAAGAYTESKRKEKERLPKGSVWAQALRSPSPADQAEWSTLPKRQRQRITIRPEASQPKASRNFRLPVQLFTPATQPSQQATRSQPTHSQPPRSASPPEPSLYTGPVTITKWTPTALRQPALPSDESGSRRRGYVLPNLRALDHAAEEVAGSPEIGYGSPQGYSRHSHTSQSARAARYGQLAQPRASNPYATPQSLAPTLQSRVEDDGDDWAAAWRLPKRRAEVPSGH